MDCLIHLINYGNEWIKFVPVIENSAIKKETTFKLAEILKDLPLNSLIEDLPEIVIPQSQSLMMCAFLQQNFNITLKSIDYCTTSLRISVKQDYEMILQENVTLREENAKLISAIELAASSTQENNKLILLEQKMDNIQKTCEALNNEKCVLISELSEQFEIIQNQINALVMTSLR